MLRRAWKYLLGVPVAIVLLTLAVINRHGVRLVLDPFRPDEPVVSLVLPFYVYLIGTLLIGIVIGGAGHVGDAGAVAAHRAPARPPRPSAGRPRPTGSRASAKPPFHPTGSSRRRAGRQAG